MSVFSIFGILALAVTAEVIRRNWKRLTVPAEMIDTPVGEVELWQEGREIKRIIVTDDKGKFLCTKKYFNSPDPDFDLSKKK